MFVCVRSTVCGWMDMSIPVEKTGLFTAVTVSFHHVVHKNQTLTIRLANKHLYLWDVLPTQYNFFKHTFNFLWIYNGFWKIWTQFLPLGKNPSHVCIQHILYMGSKLSLVSQETLAEWHHVSSLISPAVPVETLNVHMTHESRCQILTSHSTGFCMTRHMTLNSKEHRILQSQNSEKIINN